MSVSDSKRGGKVRCDECDKSIYVPDDDDDDAIQDSRAVKLKAASNRRRDADDDEDDDEDDGPRSKTKAAKKGLPIFLLLGGGVAVVILMVLVGAIGVAGYFMLGARPDEDIRIAQDARDAEQNAIEPINRPDIKIDDPNPNPPNPNPGPEPEPNPFPGPGPDPNPIPKKNPNPLPKVDPNPGQPLPGAIDPNQVIRVKQATAYLRVTMPNGQVAEGSGFFAVEPGIVITNAHVLGMLQASSKPPRQVEVTLNSGEPNQSKLIGQVLGVDRASDLAVVRVPNNANLPAPLQLENERKLIETQAVYIFGFPLGAQLGANITVSPSAVSSLRKNQLTGALEQIQVNGGMHPGNSGGPVVNAVGNVVGIAVAVIKGTQINFAVPAENVRMILEGRLDDARMGEAFLSSGRQASMPVKYTCLDPLNRVNALRVEVWTGLPGPTRPNSFDQPKQMPGDSQRLSHVISYRDGRGELDVPLPQLPVGQVYWLQPVITTAKGTQWGNAIATPSGITPLNRQPANLQVSLTNVTERTVKLKSANTSTLIAGKTRDVLSKRIEADVLESLSPDAKGARMRTAIGGMSINVDVNGRVLPRNPTVPPILRAIPPVFIVDGTNKLRVRSDKNLNPSMPAVQRAETQACYWQLCNALESVTMPMPNRMLQPMDTWQTEIPMLLRTGQKPEVVDLSLTCTFEGTRTKNQRSEAFISVAGRVKGRGKSEIFVDGDVHGKLAFDLVGGFISAANFKISSEEDGGGLTFIDSFDIDLTRTQGNPLNIQLPPETKTDPGQAKGKQILNQAGNLQANDPLVTDAALRQQNARMKVHSVNMQAGREYVIALSSEMFDSYLILESPTGQRLAQDDDGGGFPHARLVHRATQTGSHRILVTAFDAKLGAYQLTVQEIGGAVVPKGDPLLKKGFPPKDFVPKGPFKKPALSQAPTSYLKVVSTPGDFIGQGKTYDYAGDKLKVNKTARGVRVTVDAWTLDIGAPKGQFFQVGEYLNAKRFVLSGDSPGLDFFGQGRGSNKVAGEFVVWELELDGEQITRLAIDFVQRSEEKGQPLTGKLRVNSTLQ